MTTNESLAWHEVEKVSTYQQVLVQVENQIIEGRLKTGEHLPSERELAKLLGVSRPSVREALRILEAFGIIESHRGGGPSSGSTIATQPTEALTNLLRLHLALSGIDIDDLLDVRICLERWAVRSAAQHVNKHQALEIRRKLEAMRAPSLSEREFLAQDAEFHVAIARASGNMLISYLMEALRNAVSDLLTAAYEGQPNWSETSNQALEDHARILEAIERHDQTAAAELVEEHIEVTRHWHHQRRLD
jgi:DNA-binding FadR family transcriptional regulator